MDAREAIRSLGQLEKDFGALSARNPGHFIDRTPAILLRALMDSSRDLIPADHPVRGAVDELLKSGDDLSTVRVHEAFVRVGQLKAAIPPPAPTVA
jgi:hypothetical protein